MRRIVDGVIDAVLLVHSTSWRYEHGAVVLTFVVVIDAAAIGAMEHAPVVLADLARNAARAAPDSIVYDQVVEHGLRHLAWLAKEDDVVRTTLDDGWRGRLGHYVPEPFRQLDIVDAGATS